MPLRTRLIRALDDEIPASPREFSVEARDASISIARWKKEHPQQVLIEAVIFDALRDAFGKIWRAEEVRNWNGALRRVAQRVVTADEPRSDGSS